MTLQQLRDVQGRNRGDADVRALLSEIKRLQTKLVAVEQLRESIDSVWKIECGGQLAALYEFKRTMLDEPAVTAFREKRPEPEGYSGPRI